MTWRNASLTPPDESYIVIVHCPTASEPVWLGYREYDDCSGEYQWRCVDGTLIEVTHWMDLPQPPQIERRVVADFVEGRFDFYDGGSDD